MTGYVVVFEGDEAAGYSAYSPDVPGVVAAGATRAETEQLMREALAAHLQLLHERGEEAPTPSTDADVTILSPSTA